MQRLQHIRGHARNTRTKPALPPSGGGRLPFPYPTTMSSLWTLISDWALAALGGLAAILMPILGAVKQNRDRSMQNKRQLQGDPSDPNAEGVLEIAAETRRNVQELEERMDTQHRELKTILEEKT